MSCVIKLIELARGVKHAHEGCYIRDASDLTDVIVTPYIERAYRYEDYAAAFAEYKRSIGTRPDGKPDRPLTAWTIEVVNL